METYTEPKWKSKYRNYEGDGSIPPALVAIEWDDPAETPTEAIERLNREVVAIANLAPTPQELATILAALRHWQTNVSEEMAEDTRAYTDRTRDYFVEHEPLTSGEIDSLCQKLCTPAVL